MTEYIVVAVLNMIDCYQQISGVPVPLCMHLEPHERAEHTFWCVVNTNDKTTPYKVAFRDHKFVVVMPPGVRPCDEQVS